MRAFICHIVPESETTKFKSSQAANNFCYNLIRGNCFDKSISIVPISYKMRNHQEDKITFISTYKKLRFASYINLLIQNIIVAYKLKKYETVWFYNLWFLDIITYIIVKYILRKKVFIIFADYTPPKKKYSIQNFFLHEIKKSNGIISLSGRLRFNHPNMSVIPGIINKKDFIGNASTLIISSKINILFSGTITHYTGSDLLQELINKDIDAEIYISGKLEEPLNFEHNKNVHYLGYMKYNDYISLLKNKIHICLSLRNPEYKENENNFPSKILEYFSYNKLVVSTMKYPELESANYISINYNINELLKVISSIQEKPYLLNNYSNNQFINKLSTNHWKKQINKIESHA